MEVIIQRRLNLLRRKCLCTRKRSSCLLLLGVFMTKSHRRLLQHLPFRLPTTLRSALNIQHTAYKPIASIRLLLLATVALISIRWKSLQSIQLCRFISSICIVKSLIQPRAIRYTKLSQCPTRLRLTILIVKRRSSLHPTLPPLTVQQTTLCRDMGI